jgi:hypothetical protein
MRLGGSYGEFGYPMTTASLLVRSASKISLADVGSNVPDRRQPVLVGTTATLGIATIFIAARLVSRVIIVRKTAWDDYFIIIAWVCILEL